MAETATTETPAPTTDPARNTGGASDLVHFVTTPLLTAETPLGDFSIPSPGDLALAGIDLACKLFEGDAHSNRGHTYASLTQELATFEEGDPSVGPLQLTHSFFTDDPSVPVHVKFGPESPMTQQLMVDTGVLGAIDAYYLDGFDQTASRFRLDDFVRETLELESPLQPGETDDGQSFVNISDATLTEHQIGSYTVKMAETPEGELLVVVFNNTGAASLTRNPLTQESLLEDREREAPGGLGTIYQAYYWTQPLRECLP